MLLFSFRYFYCDDNALLIPLLPLCLSLPWFLGFWEAAAATSLSMKKMQNESEGFPHGIEKQEETSVAFKATAGTVWIVLYYNYRALLQAWMLEPGCFLAATVSHQCFWKLSYRCYLLTSHFPYTQGPHCHCSPVSSHTTAISAWKLCCWGSEEDFEYSSNWFFFAF